MNREEKKKYLSSYLELKAKRLSLEDEEGLWKGRAYKLKTSKYEPTGIRGTGSKKDPIIEHIDVCHEIDELEKEAAVELHKIESLISSLDNPEQRELLRYKYINGLTYREISETKMAYHVDSLIRIHRKALDNLP